MVAFKINQKLPSLNDYINACRKNKYVGARFKQDIDAMCQFYCRSFKNKNGKITAPVYLYFEWHENSKRRDWDNVQSAKKYILDAMQKCELIENDNPKHVKGIWDNVIYDNQQFVIVFISKSKCEIQNLLLERM